ncbi:MAG: NAD(P)H-hydrate dehydratase [Alkalilacustris sp.]
MGGLKTDDPAGADLFLTAAQMRALEQAEIDSGRVTGAALMDRAAHGVLQAIAADAALPLKGRALVLCGPGNNGGDGYVVARLLAAQGWVVRVLALAPPASPDAEAALAAWRALGSEVGPLTAAAVAARPAPDLVLDAVFGTGLQRPLGSDLVDALAAARHPGARVVAVDAPSGLCLDSGRVLAPQGVLPLPADCTVTFHSPKPGHVLARGAALCGVLYVVDIGLPQPEGPVAARAVTPAPDLLGKAQHAHKYDHGSVAVLSGGVGRGGAARLAARAALRVGAGLVTLACPPAALIENAARLDAVMLRPLPDAAGLRAWLAADPRLTALCLGPGLGLDARAEELVAAALGAARPAVLDADALTLIARRPDLRAQLHPGCVLTPHGGEFARLWPDLARQLEDPPARGPAFSRLDAARAAAAATGAVVLFKGPDTLVAAPEGSVWLNAAVRTRAAPWLATAGAGDVLAGLVAGLLARGLPPDIAAAQATWLHVEAARALGPGLIAEDLPEALPAVLRRLDPGPALRT